MENSNVRCKSFCMICYDESVKIDDLLNKLNSYCDYVYILHDRDYTEDGVLKKAHYHFILKFTNARWLSSISKELNIPSNYFEPCRNLKSAMQYLIHFNNEEKYQYSAEDVKGNMVALFKKYITEDSIDETTAILNIFDFIDSSKFVNITMLSRYCVSMGYWSFYRRSFSVLYNYLQEHNNNI